MNTTYFIYSKRFWFQALTIGLGVYGIIAQQFPINPALTAIVVGIINLFLAKISDKPLGFSRK